MGAVSGWGLAAMQRDGWGLAAMGLTALGRVGGWGLAAMGLAAMGWYEEPSWA
jgi:hypothetical protein